MEPAASRSSDEDGGGAGGAARGAGGGKARRDTGRLVDSTQAEDRRMIALVAARPLLFARSTLPVASYYSQVKQLWQEVADLMGWTVAEVRRKWSHIRNSYSRHLRNEIHGMRTGRGRMVSRWYLADDLEFLRQHMATDTRPSQYALGSALAFPPALLELEVPPARAWYAPPEPADSGCDPDESSAYFQFFRAIHKDYQELTPEKQRSFRRKCLTLLHRLLDGWQASAGEDSAVNLSRGAEREHKYRRDDDAD